MELVLCHAIKNVLVVKGLVLVLVIGIAQVTMQIMVDVGNMFELVSELIKMLFVKDRAQSPTLNIEFYGGYNNRSSIVLKNVGNIVRFLDCTNKTKVLDVNSLDCFKNVDILPNDCFTIPLKSKKIVKSFDETFVFSMVDDTVYSIRIHWVDNRLVNENPTPKRFEEIKRLMKSFKNK